jgi:hypothetical protein
VWSCVKWPLKSSCQIKKLNWLDTFPYNSPSDVTNICVSVLELFHACGQTDGSILTGAAQGCKRAKNEIPSNIVLLSYECTDICGYHSLVLYRKYSLIGKSTVCILDEGKVVPVLSKGRAMKECIGGVEVEHHAFCASVLDWDWLARFRLTFQPL